jgi:hypothetical protein
MVVVMDIQIIRTWGRTGLLYKLLRSWDHRGKTAHYLLENRPLSSWRINMGEKIPYYVRKNRDHGSAL